MKDVSNRRGRCRACVRGKGKRFTFGHACRMNDCLNTWHTFHTLVAYAWKKAESRGSVADGEGLFALGWLILDLACWVNACLDAWHIYTARWCREGCLRQWQEPKPFQLSNNCIGRLQNVLMATWNYCRYYPHDLRHLANQFWLFFEPVVYFLDRCFWRSNMIFFILFVIPGD